MPTLAELVSDGCGLPFAAAAEALREAVGAHGAAVVEAPPGTGKTTLAPPIISGLVEGRVVVTQPRRVAARAAARRLAALTGTPVGELVGYTVRGDRVLGADAKVEMLTPGVLLRRLLRDPGLDGTGAVILDEVHERGLDTDLLVGLLVEVRELRPDLVVIAMSATADTETLAGLLGDTAPAPVVGVPGVLHPLTARYCPGPLPLDARGVSREFLAHVATVARAAFDERPGDGDVLVFLPGAREVRVVADLLRGSVPAEVLELHGQIPAREQDRAISGRRPGEPPRIVVSTNLAESSLTVAGVRVVVDAGLSREPRRDSARGMSGLVTVRCARSSADQRAGRAARQGPGVVWRCYDEETYAGLRPQVTPESQTTDLTGALLTLAAWGSPRGATMRLPSPLPAASVAEDEAVLRSLGAVDTTGRITEDGRRLASIPASPRWARALVDGAALVGSRTAAETVAAVESGVSGDLGREIIALRRGGTPEARRWKAEADRLARLIDAAPGTGALPGAVVVLAFPERVARKVGGTYLLASGTRAAAPPELAGHVWLAVAEVTRAGGVSAAGTGAVIRSAAPIDEPTARLAGQLLVEETRGELVDGRLRARRVVALGAIELSSTPVPARELGAHAVRDVVAAHGLGVIGWSQSADALRRRMALLHRSIGGRWPDVGDDALLTRLDDWLAPELRAAADTGALAGIDLTTPLRRLLPWPEAGRLDELAPERLQVPSGSRIRLEYPPHDADGPVVVAVKLQECFGLATSPRLVDGRVEVVFHLLSPAGRPLAITGDLASFWSGPYAQVRSEMRGRYPRHPWPEDPWTAPATARTKRRG
ncbi:ATP-dependent helicase HrpB [Tessaracoccus bendigoensis DSM 12906]|uniref:RNA helicase n=1 Tax=Tessaracoccus bendigoensis DSM 12906 TaxID=1123357 RepID=A0A1M6D1X4_9ACTN|nr:ATP-dependent helicase HrpB [Tessaracoccus bendigoensis]SHI67199.1 ATP-dependent helicase HrpB [Tessaracoccus bendigoensis DSM 12906]